MIGHQAIGPDCGTGAPRRGDQSPIEAIVVGLEKHRLAPITALRDMVRQVRHHNARDVSHVCFLQPICRMVIAARRNPVTVTVMRNAACKP